MSEEASAGDEQRRWARREEILARVPRPRPGGRQPVLDQTLVVIYARALRAAPPP